MDMKNTNNKFFQTHTRMSSQISIFRNGKSTIIQLKDAVLKGSNLDDFCENLTRPVYHLHRNPNSTKAYRIACERDNPHGVQ